MDASDTGDRLLDWIRLANAPETIAKRYERVQVLHAWQKAALKCAWEGQNLLCAAPTSGGKSLVAELLLIRKLVAHPKSKALVILPYISIVQEKEKHLKSVLRPLKVRVQAHHGSTGGSPLNGGERVAVCTGEKANAAINNLAEDGRLHELRFLFVDEMHMIGESGRGVAIESLLSKLKCLGMLDQAQIVGMSATMGGVQALAKWLDAELFLTNFRPVSLTQYVQRGCDTFRWDGKRLVMERKMPSSQDEFASLVLLCEEVLQSGGQVLVFCASRRHCETCAIRMADALANLHVDKSACQRLLGDLEDSLHAAVPDVLGAVLCSAIGWHHAGLTTQERDCIETGYRSGVLRIIFATSTLAAGVNLPANRVILYRICQPKHPHVTKAQYCQMVGRAGRAGFSQYGDSFIVDDGASTDDIVNLLGRPMERISSQMVPGGSENCDNYKGIGRLLLESISSRIAVRPSDLEKLVKSTFAFHQLNWNDLKNVSIQVLDELKQAGLVTGQVDSDGNATWLSTKMGYAVSKSGLSYKEGIRLYRILSESGSCVCLDRPIFLLYSMVLDEHPFQIEGWSEWGQTFSALPSTDKASAAQLGIQEAEFFSIQAGYVSIEKQRNKVRKHSRFLAAHILCLLLKEAKLTEIEASFGKPGIVSGGLSRGILQRFQQDSATFLAMAASMAGASGWWLLESLLSSMREQLATGARPELVDLMKINGMTGDIARNLFEMGYPNLHRLAKAPLTKVEAAVLAALPRGIRVTGKRSIEMLGPAYKSKKLAESILQNTREQVAEELWSFQAALSQNDMTSNTDIVNKS